MTDLVKAVQVALVTGASRGIGKAIAKSFVDAGAQVMLTSRKEDALRAAANEMDGETEIFSTEKKVNLTIGNNTISFEKKLPNIKTWNAEKPNLYTLLMTVNGESSAVKIGFRNIQIKNSQFLMKIFITTKFP